MIALVVYLAGLPCVSTVELGIQCLKPTASPLLKDALWGEDITGNPGSKQPECIDGPSHQRPPQRRPELYGVSPLEKDCYSMYNPTVLHVFQ